MVLCVDSIRGMWSDLPTLLHAWRTNVVKMTLMDVERASVPVHKISRSTLGSWEKGEAKPDAEGLAALDGCYRAGGALFGMARALTTPQALSPRRGWAHNFQPESGGQNWSDGPVWAWVRPGPEAPDQIAAALWWGVLGVKIIKECGPNGVMVSCPVSRPHPAVFCRMPVAGWVDFGRGRIPAALGIPVYPALEHLFLFGKREAAVWVFSNALQTLLGSENLGKRLSAFAGVREDVVELAMEKRPEPVNSRDLTGEMSQTGLDPAAPFTGEEYRRLRLARGMSQKAAALAATNLLPDNPVDEDRLGRMENGSVPQAEMIRPRLDMVYGAGGHTCWEPVHPVSRIPGEWEVRFPGFWVGPVTITVTKKQTSGNPVGVMTLAWGNWQTKADVRSGTAMTLRQDTPNSPPLRITCDPGWVLTAGVGYSAEAVDINTGWMIPDNRARAEFFEQQKETYLKLFEKTTEQFSKFVGAIRRS